MGKVPLNSYTKFFRFKLFALFTIFPPTLMGLLMFLGAKNVHGEEYGLFLLPLEEDTRALKALSNQLEDTFRKEDISYNPVVNIPHLSIFQGVFEQDGLEKLKAGAQVLAQRYTHVTLACDARLEDTHENIFLNFTNPEKVAPLFDAFYDADLYKMRSEDRLMQQVQRDVKAGVGEKAQALIQTYGLYWGVPGRYRPHITLVYGSHAHPKIPAVLDAVISKIHTLTFTQLGVGRLGFEGNVTEVIRTYPLRF